MTLPTRLLGQNGPAVSAIGLGCMGMSHAYGQADEAESTATIHAALEAGVTLFDTGDFYGMGHNELLLGRALAGKRDRAFIQVKFGAQRSPDGQFIGFDTRPAALKTALAYTLQRLGTDYIDLYQPARLDPAVPIEETVGAIAEMVKAGYIRHIGLSEMGAATIRRAAAVHPIAGLQIEYSLIDRGIEAAILPTCRDLGIAVTAYGVLSRGLLGGAPLGGQDDYRRHSPRFQDGNLAHNQALAARLRQVAEAHGLTPAQAAIAWVASRGEDIIPLIGTSKRSRLAEALATPLTLPPEVLAAIDAAIPAGAVKGDRYAAAQMRMLDSERPTAAYEGMDAPTPDAGADTRARILDTAEALLRRHGPDKVNVVDVARALGMSHANVYRHFASKQALRAAVGEAWLQRICAPLDAIASSDAPPARRLSDWLHALAALKRRKVLEEPEMFAALHRVVTDSPEVLASHLAWLRAQVAAILAAGQRDGSLPGVTDPAEAAAAVLDASTRFHHPELVARGGPSAVEQAALDRVITLLLRGLGQGDKPACA